MATSEQRQEGPTGAGSVGRILAWGVHAFTATSAIIALMALMAILRGEFHVALLWLLGALVVDGIDGTLARAAKVKERVPRIDGDSLDLIVDYLTYVFVPTIFLWKAGLIPEGLAPWLAAAIQLSSLYLFARSDMKSDDNYFRGFPALWNVVAFYLFALQSPPAAGAIVVALFVLLTFAPVYFVHPFRVKGYGPLLPILATVWALATLALLWPGWESGLRTVWLAVSLGSAAALLGIGLLRTVRGR
jgi:phosphatidylcholine synthase